MASELIIIMIIALAIPIIVGVGFILIGRKMSASEDTVYDGVVEGTVVDWCFDWFRYNRDTLDSVFCSSCARGSGGAYPVVKYTVGGVTYKRALNQSYRQYYVEDMVRCRSKVTVYYMTEHPEWCSCFQTESAKGGGKAFIGLGVGCLVIAWYLAWLWIRSYLGGE